MQNRLQLLTSDIIPFGLTPFNLPKIFFSLFTSNKHLTFKIFSVLFSFVQIFTDMLLRQSRELF